MKEENISEPKKPWPFLWSKISLGLSIGAWLLFIIGIPAGFAFRYFWNVRISHFDIYLITTLLLSLSCAIAAFCAGGLSSLGFLLYKLKPKNKEKAFGGLGLSVFYFIIALVLCPGLKQPKDSGPGYSRIMCASKIKQIAVGFIIYQEELSWPSKSNWCDSLEPYIGLAEDGMYQCPIDKIGPCSYAMNENIPDDANELPADLVILFEAAPGWNQVGGADDVVTDRHGKPGANIAFAAGRVEFVDAEDIPTLRWAIDKNNNRHP